MNKKFEPIVDVKNIDKQKIESKEETKFQNKEVDDHLGVCSFSKASKEVLKCISNRESKCFKFSEKRSGDIWEIDFKIRKTPVETFTDEKGRIWQRIS